MQLSRFFTFSLNMRLRIAGIVAIAGLAVGGISLAAFEHQITGPNSGFFFLVCACVGAFGAGFCVAPLLGRPGVSGAAVSLLGFLCATLLGGCLAGLAYLPMRNMDLVAALMMMLFLTPLVVFWACAWAGVHWGSKWQRKSAPPTT